MTAAKPWLRPKSYTAYEALLRLHIRPTLGTKSLGAVTQFDIQRIYAEMFGRGLSARTIEYPIRIVATVTDGKEVRVTRDALNGGGGGGVGG